MWKCLVGLVVFAGVTPLAGAASVSTAPTQTVVISGSGGADGTWVLSRTASDTWVKTNGAYQITLAGDTAASADRITIKHSGPTASEQYLVSFPANGTLVQGALASNTGGFFTGYAVGAGIVLADGSTYVPPAPPAGSGSSLYAMGLGPSQVAAALGGELLAWVICIVLIVGLIILVALVHGVTKGLGRSLGPPPLPRRVGPNPAFKQFKRRRYQGRRGGR